jgi:hypothetical protein
MAINDANEPSRILDDEQIEHIDDVSMDTGVVAECAIVEVHRTTKGAICESLAVARMLDNRLEVFSSVVDIDGIDFIVRAKGGAFLEVQVKGVHAEKWPEWFNSPRTRTSQYFDVVRILLSE